VPHIPKNTVPKTSQMVVNYHRKQRRTKANNTTQILKIYHKMLPQIPTILKTTKNNRKNKTKANKDTTE